MTEPKAGPKRIKVSNNIIAHFKSGPQKQAIDQLIKLLSLLSILIIIEVTHKIGAINSSDEKHELLGKKFIHNDTKWANRMSEPVSELWPLSRFRAEEENIINRVNMITHNYDQVRSRSFEYHDTNRKEYQARNLMNEGNRTEIKNIPKDEDQEQLEKDLSISSRNKRQVNQMRDQMRDTNNPNVTISIIRQVIGQSDTLFIPCSTPTNTLTINTSQHTGHSNKSQLGGRRKNQIQKHSNSQPLRSHNDGLWSNGASKMSDGGVSLLVWHKDDQLDQPIFIADARGVESLREAKQVISFDLLKGRARLDEAALEAKQGAQSNVPALVITQPNKSDSGLYTCTVEFNQARTQTHQVKVQMISQPQNMVIKDDNGLSVSSQSFSTFTNSYNEGSRLTFTCQAERGDPETGQISWWKLSEPSRVLDPSNRPSADKSVWEFGDWLTTVGVPFPASLDEENLRPEMTDYFVAFHSEPPNKISYRQTQLMGSQRLRFWQRIDSSPLEVESSDFSSTLIRSNLQLGLTRSELGKEYLCLAQNNHHSAPVNSSLRVNLNLKPIEVKIINKDKYNLTLDQKVVIECEVRGSKPRAKIRWFRNNIEIDTTIKDQLRAVGKDYASEIVRDKPGSELESDTTISYLTFVPQLSDDEQNLACSASNPMMSNEPAITDLFLMDVKYPPQLTLKLGQNLRPDSIKLGADVFMDCDINSNPPAQINDLTWLHNGIPMKEDASLGIRFSGQSLVLSHIELERRGFYQCQAQNVIGASTSNRVELRPKFEPICDTNRTKSQVEVKLNKAIKIDCFVEADPNDDIHFEWKINKTIPSDSGPVYRVIDIKHYETNSSQSHIKFEPKTIRDYGQLICSASNSIGRQLIPCIIEVSPSSVPDPVFNCFSDSLTNSSFSIHCQPPVDSGNGPSSGRINYVIDFHPDDPMGDSANGYSSSGEPNRQRQSTTHLRTRDHDEYEGPNGFERDIRQIVSETPSFELIDLQPDTRYKVTIYAQNLKGRSEPTFYKVSTLPEYKGKRIQLSNAKAIQRGEPNTLSERLISYLNLSDYVDVGTHSKQLVEICLIVLLCTITIGLVSFLFTQFCSRSSTRRKRSGARVSIASIGSSSTTNRLEPYDKRQLTSDSTVQLASIDQARVMKGLAGGSDTSRETNTESTLISSSRTNNTNTGEIYTIGNKLMDNGVTLSRRNHITDFRGQPDRRMSPATLTRNSLSRCKEINPELEQQIMNGGPIDMSDAKPNTPQISLNSGHTSSHELQTDQISLVCSHADDDYRGDPIYLIGAQASLSSKMNQQGYNMQPSVRVINPSNTSMWPNDGNSFNLNEPQHLSTCRLYGSIKNRYDNQSKVHIKQQPQFGCIPNSFSIPVSMGDLIERRAYSRQEYHQPGEIQFCRPYMASSDALSYGMPMENGFSEPMHNMQADVDVLSDQIQSPEELPNEFVNSHLGACSSSDGDGNGSRKLHVKFENQD